MSGFVSEKPVPVNSPPHTVGSDITSIRKEEEVNESYYTRFLHSFRRAEEHSDVASLEEQKYHTDLNKTQEKLKRTMKTRHVTMISLGTGIGTGLLVASGKALRYGGPGGLIIGYMTISTMLYCVVQACCELGVAYSSLPGNYNTYPTFLVDRGFGFAVALVYGLQWCIVLPLELVTASMTIKYWETSVNPDVFVAVFYVFIVFIHFFGSRGYAEAEFLFNTLKVLLMAGFIIMGICLVSGASNGGYVGAKYWRNPGAFPGSSEMSKFKGVCSVWVQSAFAYGASEFIALTAAEQANPRESVPRATKHWLYRVFLVFLTPMTLVCFLVPYDSNQLLDTAGTSASHASPFVIAAAFHGVKVVPHIINFIILSSVISVGNSAMYSAPRILLSLAENGLFPKVFTYVDREGRPLATLLFACVWGLLSFAAASKDQETIFTWLSAVVGLSQLFTWSAIALSHIRFRAAMKAQNHSIRELGYRAITGVAGSYYALFFNIVVLVAQFWVAIAPIGNGGKVDGVNFLKNYLAFPVLCLFYFGYKIWNRDTQILIPADKVDLQSHRQIFDAEAMMQEELERKERLKHASMFKKFVTFWC